MKAAILSTLAGTAFLAQQSFAHPGQSAAEHAKEVAERSAYLNTHKRSLAHCSEKLKARGNDIAMHQRRSAMVEKLRAKRGISQEKPYLKARDADEVLNTNHQSNLTGITPDVDPSVIFAGNNSCILTPETTQGPYWVSGELVRQDIDEGQQGVPLTLDVQIIDVNTCEPVPQAFLEIWHCNSTGVYSGVVASGNGNTNDDTNLDATFMRGIQESDENGVVTFNTLVPGHYTGRTNHIHVMSHIDSSVLENNTVSGGAITHVGQMFFDQDLVTLVEATEPYASNTQELTTNAEDSIFEGESDGYDPVVEYVLLGDDISEGIFAWIAFGQDSTSDYNITAAAYWTEDGGVENENAGAGMGGGPPPDASGAAPSGAIPTGEVPTGAAPTEAAATTTAAAEETSSDVSSSLSTVVSSAGAARPSGARPSGAPGQGQPGQNQPGQNQQGQNSPQSGPSKQNKAPQQPPARKGQF